MKRVCPVCGKEFYSSRSHNRYCSTDCFKIHRKKYYQKRYRENKEKFNKRSTEYFLKHKEQIYLNRKRNKCCSKFNGIENCPYTECRYEDEV